MTTLAGLKPGQAFMFVAQVTAIDAAGTHLSLFGPADAAGGNALIDPNGVLSGQLTSPAAQIPVTVVTQFVTVSAGDVLSNNASGETVVARAVTVQPDGSYLWSPAPAGGVVHKTDGWTIIGHVSLLLRRLAAPGGVSAPAGLCYASLRTYPSRPRGQIWIVYPDERADEPVAVVEGHPPDRYGDGSGPVSGVLAYPVGRAAGDRTGAHRAKRRGSRRQPPGRAYRWAVLAVAVVIWGAALWALLGGR